MSYATPPKAELSRPYRQVIFGVFLSTIVVRTSVEPVSLAAALRKAVWAVDPNQPIVKVETMDDIIANSIWRPRASAWLFQVLGALALLLTATGIYCVVSYTTVLRAHEVGIRMALGATPKNIIAVIVQSALLPLLTGLVIAAVTALFLSSPLSSLLYEINPTDPITYVTAPALLLTIGAIASARPAWKAAAGYPIRALRME